MNRKQTTLTYAAAHATIWGRLQAAGWKTKLKLRYPRATYRIGRVVVALHFKPQALYSGWTRGAAPQANDARSTGVDVREWAAMPEADMMAEVRKGLATVYNHATGVGFDAAAEIVGAA